jgi:hypothetical protein
MQNSKDCHCTIAGKAPECPEHHRNMDKLVEMEREAKTKSRMFHRQYISDEPEQLSSEEEQTFKQYIPKDLHVQKREAVTQIRRGLIDDTNMMERNRNSLNKFESLSIQGQTLTGISIGGFDIDLTKAAEKTMEILPLPASKLPVIFTDENLNFYHHFFQGMTILLGRENVEKIAGAEFHYNDDPEVLLVLVENMISSGFEKSDTESTLLIKKVLSSTFEPTEYRPRNEEGPRLKVVANLWGFQYIECGMQMAEVDLRMWFSMCYSHYRTIWFNTFKTTGIPTFATQGVRRSRQSSSSSSTMPSLVEVESDRGDDMRSTVSRSRRKKRASDRSVRSYKRQMDDQQSSQITRWLGGRT